MFQAEKVFRELVKEEDLLFLGIVPLAYEEDYSRFQDWIHESKHAGLKYLEEGNACRKDPKQLLPGAEVAIVLALPYFQEEEFSAPLIAQYARFSDYHKLLKKKGQAIVEKFKIKSETDKYLWRAVVDTAPVLERALAAKTFSGFIGKNTCYIHPEHGSFLLLTEILTSYPFAIDKKVKDKGCGSCSLCQVACPTGALSEDYKIDTAKCLAYWTIENRGPIPEKYWPYLADFVFGCDICQSVCPYNDEARGNALPKSITPKSFPPLFEIATMTQPNYEKYFGGTPLTRAKRNGLRRNALIAMSVTNDPQLEKALALSALDCDEPILTTISQIQVRGGC